MCQNVHLYTRGEEKISKNVNHIDIKTMRVGSNSVRDAADDDDDIKDERQEDIHRDEGYLMEDVMTNTAQLVKQTAHQVCQCLILTCSHICNDMTSLSDYH